MLGLVAWAALLAVAPAEVEWVAPAECPDRADVMARVDRYLIDAPEPEQPVTARAEVSRDGNAWTLRLVTRIGDEEQERVVTDRDCDGLAETAAVLVAIAVSPEVAEHRAEPREEPVGLVPRVEPQLEAEPNPPPQRVDRFQTESTEVLPPPPPKRRRPHLSARSFGGASLGWLPIGGDVGLAMAVFWKFVRIEVSGLFSPRRRVRFDDIPDAGVDASGWVVGAQGCGVIPTRPWLGVPLCLGIEAGQVLGRPVRLVDGQVRRPPTLAGVFAPSLRFEVHPRVALWVSPQLLVPVVRAQLSVRGDEPLFRAAPIGARFHGGLEIVLLR